VCEFCRVCFGVVCAGKWPGCVGCLWGSWVGRELGSRLGRGQTGSSRTEARGVWEGCSSGGSSLQSALGVWQGVGRLCWGWVSAKKGCCGVRAPTATVAATGSAPRVLWEGAGCGRRVSEGRVSGVPTLTWRPGSLTGQRTAAGGIPASVRAETRTHLALCSQQQSTSRLHFAWGKLQPT
jgi:hypothetical protein